MPNNNDIPEIDLTNLNINAPPDVIASIADAMNATAPEPQSTMSDIPVYDVRGMGWENISVPVENHLRTALHTSNLDWKVMLRTVQVDGATVPGRFATTRSDLPVGHNVLEIVGSKYKIVQNEDALAFVQNIIEAETVPFTLERAGALNGGRTVFILARTTGIEIAGEKIKPYVIFSNSHDGTSSVQVALTTIRVSCKNTLALALKTAARKWSVMHTKSADDKIKAAMESMNFIQKYLTVYPAVVEEMMDHRISEIQFAEIANTLYPVPVTTSTNATSVRNAENVRATFENVYNERPDLQQHIGTAWGVYNAVTFMESHAAPKRTTPRFEENRFIRNAMNGNRMVRAQQVIMTA